MSEKLTAFLSFYSSKASEEVERIKTKLVEHQEKWKKLNTEDYPAALKTATDLGQLETFQQVFPRPGEFVYNVTKYTSLLGIDDDFKKQISDLYKTRGLSVQIEITKQRLAKAEVYAKDGGEEYLNRLTSRIFQKTADISSDGANFNTVISNLFKSPEDYKEQIEELIDTIPGPDYVLDSPETYVALLEKKEAGAFTTSTKTEGSAAGESSPINEPTADAATGDTGQTPSNINLTESVEPKGAENTTEGTATVTESKPEIIKTESAPPTGTSINLNLEKAVEPSAAPEASTVSQSVINENTVSAPAPQSGPTQSEVTQQNIDLSTANTASSSTINTQNIGESVSTTGGGTMASTSVDTTINQPALEPAKEKPGFFKKAMAAAGKALSPLAERLGENSKDMLEIANYRLNQVLPINTVSKLFSKKEKETTGANQLNLTNSSPTSIDNTKTETNVAGTQTNNMSTTANQPIIETNIEKINPAVEGNPTTAAVETKTESPTPTSPTAPTAPTLTEASPSIPTSGSSPTPAPTQPQTSSGIDVSSLEKRLKKIEIALTNPLEVIIKDH